MNQNRKRPKCIEDLVREVNAEMVQKKLKLDETNRLFFAIQAYLIHHGWYRGFNFFHTETFVDSKGNINVGPRLHGSDIDYEYIQFF